MSEPQIHYSLPATIANRPPTTQSIPSPPQGWQRFVWLGPSFLWMLSAAGSGELLFTPRIAALYGYSLLWALLAQLRFTLSNSPVKNFLCWIFGIKTRSSTA